VGDFEETLLRLKERVGVPSDKGIAELLGMGEKALNARKRRGSFPVDKLKALAADRPDLRLDVKYVLTGESDELERRLAAISTATRIAEDVAGVDARRAVQQRAFEAIVSDLDKDEQRLVSCYRSADAQGKAVLLSTASLLANAQPAKPKRKGAK
jgi:hypothetical protein